MSIKYHQWGTGDEYGANFELTDNWNPNADYGNEYVNVYFRINTPLYDCSYGFHSDEDRERWNTEASELIKSFGIMDGSRYDIERSKEKCAYLYAHPQSISGVILKNDVKRIAEAISKMELSSICCVDLYETFHVISDKEVKNSGFEISEDEFASNVNCFTDCGFLVEIEEIDDDRFYINYMCYQDEVHEATETETDEFNLTPEQTEKLISDYEDFIRQMESLKEKEEPVATAEPEETAEEPTAEKQTTSEETEEEPITEENTKVTEAEEKFSETYKKNAERMYALKTLMETARDRGDRELERKYRKEYTAIKSEIDMYALQIINQ